MHLIGQLLRLLHRRDRAKLFALGLLQFTASGLEVIGIAAILPFIQIVGEPSLLLEHEVSGPILHRIGLTGPSELIWFASIALAAFFIVKSVFIAISIRLFYGFLYDQYVAIATQLYDGYLRSSYLYHLRQNSSRLVRNVTQEVNNVVGTILHGITLPKEILVSVGLVVVLFLTNSVATLAVVALLGGFGFLVGSYTGKRLSQKGRVRVEEQARTIQSVNEGLGSITEIKVLGRERHFVDDLSGHTRKLTDALLGSVLYQQYPRLLIETMGGLAAVTIVAIPLLSGQNLVDILPVLALFGVAFVRLIPSSNRVIQAVNAIRFAAPSIAVIYDEMDVDPEVGSGDKKLPRDARIEVCGVSYAYPPANGGLNGGLNGGANGGLNGGEGSPAGAGVAGKATAPSNGAGASPGESPAGVKALDDVSFTIEPGQMISFVGPSGAGKTTLVGVLLGLLAPTEGRVLVDGKDLRDCMQAYRRNIGYIPQDIYLLDNTIRRNVAFGLPEDEIDDAMVWRALEAAQLAAFVRGLPEQLETVVGERGILVSAGQRQRIGIARALYHDPPLLVLDEATSALDNETERHFADAIERLSSKTVIVIAHRLTTIRHSDVIHVLEAGRLVGSGSYETLRNTNAVFRRLVGETPVVHLSTKAAG